MNKTTIIYVFVISLLFIIFFAMRERGVRLPTKSPRLSIRHKIKNRFFYLLNNNKLPFLSLPLWLLVDFFRKIRKKEDLHIYGIYGYFGLWGQGKTIGMTKELYDLRKKYGDDIYIFTNYGFKLEDKPFTDWHMLLEEYDKPCVFAWDEVQNEFNSRDFKNFPTALLTQLTQNRKGNGKRILYSAQRWVRVDKVFRELTYICYECKTRFGRLTGIRGYDWEEYEQLTSTANVNMKIRIHSKTHKIFVQTDYLRGLYDSYQMLHTAKTKEYLDRNEIQKLTES